jgi:D-threonate/D-erythronate kinase
MSMGASAGRARRILTIADDLTGACDAAVYFAEAGLATFVGLHFDDAAPANWESWAVNTNTRCSPPQEAYERTLRAFEDARQLQPGKIVKKIDSMMRGNVAAEIAAASAVLRPRLIVLTPAFPALGRTVHEGGLSIHGGEPLAVASFLPGLRCATASSETVEVLANSFAAAANGQVDVLVPDASTEADLRRIVEAGGAMEGVLWVGSGGLTGAIASSMSTFGMNPFGRRRSEIKRTHKPILFCVGSNHDATLAQLQHLKKKGEAVFAPAGIEGYERVNRALRKERNALLLLERNQFNPETLRELAQSVEMSLCGALVLTGGDTAFQVLDALGVCGIRSFAEILPGIPQGEILGGAADGLLLATKSGAFGGVDALSRCVEMLRVPPADLELSNKEVIR